MAKRVCLDCPALTDDTRCPSCTRKRDQARGSSTARGYGYSHQQQRARLAPLVATGNVKCWRCGDYITGAFDLGHDDNDRSKYRGPECIKCNRGTATRR